MMAAPMVTGTVSQDATTGVYTYTYSINNTGGLGDVTQLNLKVNSYYYAIFQPLSSSSPNGWALSTGWIADNCDVECGGFWQWRWLGPTTSGLAPGETQSGFAFQTTVAPSSSTANDYFLYYPSEPTGSNQINGNVVAPDYLVHPPAPPVYTPEPSTCCLLAAGFASLGVFLARRRLALADHAAAQ